MSEEIAASVNLASAKEGAAKHRRPGPLEKVRGEFAKLLRARIAEKERELEGLRAELSSIGGTPSVRRTQLCSVCGKSGHTRRTCTERRTKPSEEQE
jgi:hypothetical protein